MRGKTLQEGSSGWISAVKRLFPEMENDGLVGKLKIPVAKKDKHSNFGAWIHFIFESLFELFTSL